MMTRNEWKTIAAEDYCLQVADGTHDTPKPIEVGEYLVTSKHITGGRVDLSGAYKISKNDFDQINIRSKVDKWDVLITMIGTVGEVVLVDHDPNYAIKNIGLFKCGDELKAKWLKYYLQSPTGITEIQSRIGGTTQEYIALGELRKLPISYPPIAQQKAIVNILSSLDDKIDLLRRQNKTLESLASALWRKMFIEEAGANGAAVKLGNYVECVNGVSYKSDDLRPSRVAMLTLKSFNRNGGFRFDGFKEYAGEYKERHLVAQGELLVAHTDITQEAEVIGNPIMVIEDPKYEKFVFSMDLVKVTPTVKWLSQEFLYLLMRTEEFKQHCLGHSNGSTVLHLSKKAVPSFEFMRPSEENVSVFTVQAKDIFAKHFENISQIGNLEKMRDSLLPRLMSGDLLSI